MVEAVRLERMVHGGAALGRLQDGRIVLVEGGIPGEHVRVGLRVVKGVHRGVVEEVLEPSPDRLTSPAHPGLDYGHIRYPRQLGLKAEVVADALRRAVGRDLEVLPVRPSPQTWGYRATVQPALVPAGLGYRRAGTREVVVLEVDETANAAVRSGWDVILAQRAALAGVREVVLRGNDEGEVLAALVADVPEQGLLDVAHALVREGLTGVSYAAYDPRGRFRSGSGRLAGARGIRQRYGDVDLSVSATSFAQPNPDAMAALLATLVDWAPGGSHAWELYAGGGAISFQLAKKYEAVTALEIDRSALSRGRNDGERLGIDNVRFVRADLRSVPMAVDAELIVVDPPRTGLAAPLRQAIAESAAEHLIYVSCDVATWARDTAELEQRGLRLARFEPFDFYPHTHHVEILSLFERAEPASREPGLEGSA